MVGRITSFVVALACSLALAVVPGQSFAAGPLELAEVIEAVDRAHPDVEAAQWKAEAAEAKAFGARGVFDPKLSIRSRWSPVGYYENAQVDALLRQVTPVWGLYAYAGYRLGWGSYPIYKGELQTLSAGEVRAGVGLPLWRNRSIDEGRATLQRARILQRGADRALDATRLQREREAAEAYWSWVAAGQSLGVARELLRIAETRNEGLAEQVAAGALEPIVLADNRRLVLDRAAKLVAAERKFQEVTLELSLFLRDQRQRPIVVPEARVPATAILAAPTELDLASLEQEVERALTRRPDVAALRAEIEAAQVTVTLAKNQRAPSVDLHSFVAKDFGEGPDDLAPMEWAIGADLELPIPLRKARGELRAAKAELAGTQAKLRGLVDETRAEIQAAHVALRAAARIARFAQEQQALAEQLAEAERMRWREGDSDLVIVNLRELAAADAEVAAIEAAADYRRARADFLVSTGRSPRS